jgi:hypothetical protein
MTELLIPRLSDDDLKTLRAKYPQAVELDLAEDGIGYPVALPFTFEAMDRYVGEMTADSSLANGNAAVRHVLHPTVKELQQLRRAHAAIGAEIVAVLCTEAGMFLSASDPLKRDTPPGVLERAGLDAATAAKLLESLPPHRRARIVVTVDDEQIVHFACVVGTPREQDMLPFEKAQKGRAGERIGQVARQCTLGCVLWCRDGNAAELFRTPEHCGVPSLILMPILQDMYTEAAVRGSKRGRRSTR